MFNMINKKNKNFLLELQVFFSELGIRCFIRANASVTLRSAQEFRNYVFFPK